MFSVWDNVILDNCDINMSVNKMSNESNRNKIKKNLGDNDNHSWFEMKKIESMKHLQMPRLEKPK